MSVVDSNEVRACLLLKPEKLTLYLNAVAAKRLADRLTWLANSDPNENFEIHVAEFLDAETVLNPTSSTLRVSTLVDDALADHIVRPGPAIRDGEEGYILPFDLNLMMATNDVIESMSKA